MKKKEKTKHKMSLYSCINMRIFNNYDDDYDRKKPLKNYK